MDALRRVERRKEQSNDAEWKLLQKETGNEEEIFKPRIDTDRQAIVNQ